MNLLYSLKKIATISSTSLCLSITATWISKTTVKAQVVDANDVTHQSFINLVSDQSIKPSSWLISNNNFRTEPFASNFPSETKNSHSLLFGLIFLGIVTAWEVKFNFFGVTPSQILQKVYCQLPHYQKQLQIQNLQTQLQQQLKELQNTLQSQHTNELQQLQNQIEHIENEFAVQIEERINSLFADHSEDVQQRLEACINRWQTQHTNELQQLQNRIEHIENEFAVQIEERINSLFADRSQKIQQRLEARHNNWRSRYSNRLQQVQAKIEGSEENFGRINTEVNNLRQEIDNCNHNIACLSGSYREPQTTSEAEDSISLEFNTVLEVLLKAEQKYPIIEIFDSAKTSAEESRYSNYKKIYSALKVIAEIGKKYFEYQQESASMGHRLETEFQNRGFANNYRPTEHEETENQFGRYRRFCHRGQCIEIFRHLTFNNNGCSLQIYFEFDREQEKVIIGYCGKHLPIASYRT